MKDVQDFVVYDGRAKLPVIEKVYTQGILELGKKHEDVVCLTADMTYLLEVDAFRDSFPERVFNVGMGEQNMIGIASGLAQAGEVPFAHTFACFLTRRCMDQIVNAVAYPRLNVKMIGMMPGITSHGGPSHQAIDDIAYMRGTPHITVFDIGDSTEAEQIAEVAYETEGPVYVRMRRAKQFYLFDASRYKLEAGQSYLLRSGSDVSLIASGIMTKRALEAAALLSDAGISANVLHVPCIKPIDAEGILDAASRCRAVITLDNHNIIGGLGSAVGEVLLQHRVSVPFHRIGITDTFGKAASEPYLARMFGMEPEQIAETARNFLEGRDVSAAAPSVTDGVLSRGGGWDDSWKNGIAQKGNGGPT
jgi:transketolase